MNIDIKTSYEEGCSAIRHYSLALRNIRTIAVAQGFAVLTAASYLAKEEKYVISAGAALFGILLTGIIYQFHMNYYSHVRAVVQYVVKLEQDNLKTDGGAWTSMENMRRDVWVRRPLVRFALNKALYILLVLSLLTVFAYNITYII